MKKKLFITLVVAFALAFVFAISAFAATHCGVTIDTSKTVTLSGSYTDASGNPVTTVRLFDDEGNALIWYKNGSTLESIRADDSRVIYTAGSYTFNVGNSTVGSKTAYEVTSMKIALESGDVDKGNIVVLNLMDDDVIINDGGNIGKPVNCLKIIAWANKVLEYAYCRLDTVAIQQQAFSGCPMLKYINLEDLTELRQIGGGQTFSQTYGQTVLFQGQVLDLTKTKLVTISGNGSFTAVPFVGIKLPATTTFSAAWMFQHSGIESITIPTTVTKINDNMFKGCNNLTTIYISNTTTEIANDVFKKENNREPQLEKIFFVGTKAELEALISNTNSSNNTPFFTVVGENNANLISYADYQKLEDKSGYYAVYDYSYCEAYNNGVHSVESTNPCVGTCSTCGMTTLSHKDGNTTVEVVYADYTQVGKKVTSCQNEGCAYCQEEALEALITCNGYSVENKETGNGIVIGYRLNQAAMDKYYELTGKTVKYGIYAAAKTALGDNDIIGADGTPANGSVIAEINTGYVALQLKMGGFDDLDAQFTMGAYLVFGEGEGKEYAYIEGGTPLEGEKYYFVSYNSVANANK